MLKLRLLCCGILTLGALSADDLSRYREFRLGMDLPSVAKLAQSRPEEAKTLYSKPALMQELEWRPQFSSQPSGQTDTVRVGLFSFYAGALYRMLIAYDGDRTEGLTADDLTEALQSAYGTAAHPSATVTVISEGIEETASVIAQWESADALVRLVRVPYRSAIALLVTGKRLDALAERATMEAKRLEVRDAPQHDADRQKQEADDERAALAKSRLANKPNFRP